MERRRASREPTSSMTARTSSPQHRPRRRRPPQGSSHSLATRPPRTDRSPTRLTGWRRAAVLHPAWAIRRRCAR
eukprot:259317-Pleurochrysis_carterae.AAC.1